MQVLVQLEDKYFNTDLACAIHYKHQYELQLSNMLYCYLLVMCTVLFSTYHVLCLGCLMTSVRFMAEERTLFLKKNKYYRLLIQPCFHNSMQGHTGYIIVE